MTFAPPVPVSVPSSPLPHVAVSCLPGCLAVRWLHDARGDTRLTLIVRERSRDVTTFERRMPTDARDVAQCVAFAAAVAGVARGDAAILGIPPTVVRIPVGPGAPSFLGVEFTWAHDGAFSVIAAEPSVRSPCDTVRTLDAFIAAVAGDEAIPPPEVQPCGGAPEIITVTSDAADAFARVQRQEPAIIAGVLPWMYRTALAYAVTGARGSLST